MTIFYSLRKWISLDSNSSRVEIHYSTSGILVRFTRYSADKTSDHWRHYLHQGVTSVTNRVKIQSLFCREYRVPGNWLNLFRRETTSSTPPPPPRATIQGWRAISRPQTNCKTPSPKKNNLRTPLGPMILPGHLLPCFYNIHSRGLRSGNLRPTNIRDPLICQEKQTNDPLPPPPKKGGGKNPQYFDPSINQIC